MYTHINIYKNIYVYTHVYIYFLFGIGKKGKSKICLVTPPGAGKGCLRVVDEKEKASGGPASDLSGARKTADDGEYSDPFDAQPEAQLGASEQLPPDNSYMEPYDAQCGVTDLQLYDTPYEEQVVGNSPEAEGRPRHSRLPRDDERPAEEYDQPWEWKKDHISRAFAVQFENPEWERAPGLAKELRKPPAKTSGGWVGKGPNPEEHSPQPAERVDPALPLEKQPWFHGSLSRAEAENLLSLCREGSYLVRQSETSHPDFSLSLRGSQGYMHMKFSRTKDNKFVLGQHSGVFSSVPEVVHHYSIRPLPVQGSEHLALLHPIAVQTP
ncbi:SH2 domain-containing adapter protein D isoform 2-T2 [Sarcophilus harrisii]